MQQQQQQQQPELNPNTQLSKHPAHCAASPTDQAAIFIKENVKRQGLIIENGRRLQFCEGQENYFRQPRQQRTISCHQPPTRKQSNLRVGGSLSFSYCLANPTFKPFTARCQKADDTARYCTAISSLKCFSLTIGTAVFITQLYIVIYKFTCL